MREIVYVETSVVSYLTGRRSKAAIEVLVDEAGYGCPIICTSEELMED